MSFGAEHQPRPDSEQQRRNDWDAHADTRSRIQEGYACFDPDSFDLFLTLPDVDLTDPRVLDRYSERCLGTFDSMMDATYVYLERVGWMAATAMFLTSATTEEGRPKWDWIRINRAFKRACHIIERDGQFHVFTR